MPLVLVTEPEFRKGEAVFRAERSLDCQPAPPAEDALAAAVRAQRARHVVVGGRVFRGPLYAALERGGVIARFGVGHDGIDKTLAAERGLLCTNTPHVLTESVAEHAMLLILAAARRLPMLAPSVATAVWTPPVGVELAGKTLAIVGCGAIGRATARIARQGFGMRVVGCSRSRAHKAIASAEAAFDQTTTDFGAAVSGAHFVSLHIPASPENSGFIGRERLALCRPDAWLINTARGAVVDETALFQALTSGRLAGAALDVFAREPYDALDPSRDLRRLPNVILTPHVGSHTTEANHAMAARALRNLHLAEEGRLAEMDLLGSGDRPICRLR